MTYSDKLKDPRWQKKRLEVMQRDGFKCTDCNNAKSTLQVHHCFYAKGEPWETEDKFLLTLCEPCHVQRQDLEADCKRALGMIMARLRCAPNDMRLYLFAAQLVTLADSDATDIQIVSASEDAAHFG